MQIIIKGKQMDVPPRLREHIERKVQRLSRLVNADTRIEVTVTEEQTRSARDRFSVQVALSNNAHPIRSEVSALNANMALDLVLDKVTTQLGRQKDRQTTRKHHAPSMRVLSLSRSGDLISLQEDQPPKEQAEEPLDEERNEEIWSKVMEIRHIATKPMNDREVIAQMEAHKLDFYPFFNEETRSVNVIYRLEQGGYGLLVPALEGIPE